MGPRIVPYVPTNPSNWAERFGNAPASVATALRITLLGEAQAAEPVSHTLTSETYSRFIAAKARIASRTAENVLAAIEMLKNNPQDLLILDMVMPPGINGTETYRRAVKIYPGLKAIIVSGYSETEMVSVAQKLGAGPFVKKPLTQQSIAMAVRSELDQKGSSRVADRCRE